MWVSQPWRRRRPPADGRRPGAAKGRRHLAGQWDFFSPILTAPLGTSGTGVAQSPVFGRAFSERRERRERTFGVDQLENLGTLDKCQQTEA